MADLVVDTRQLHSAGVQLSEVARVAQDLEGRGGRLSPLIPAVGRDGAAQAVASFLQSWIYGVGWIAAQAQELSRMLGQAAWTYETLDRQLAGPVPSGRVPAIALPRCVTTAPLPDPTRPNWTVLESTISQVPVQLSAAKHAGQLIPGDPEEVGRIARLLVGFSEELGQARSAVRLLTLGGWQGAAAEAAEADLERMLTRLTEADDAFSVAADALASYGRTHAEARALAERALTMWQAAEHASALARGAAVATGGAAGSLPTGVDPDAELARAAAILATARETLEAAERRLVSALGDAERNSPNDPGILSYVNRAITSLATGLAEGVRGMGDGSVEMALLGARLSTTRMVVDPEGWQKDIDTLWTGLQHAKSDWKGSLAAFADVDGFKSDWVRATGRLLPEVAMAITGAWAAGAARDARATARVYTNHERSRAGDIYPDVDQDWIDGRAG